MKKLSALLSFACLVLFGSAFAYAAPAAHPAVELDVFIESYMLPADATGSGRPWDMPVDNGISILWDKKGPTHEVPVTNATADTDSANSIHMGTTYITVAGKEFFAGNKPVSQKAVPWIVRLTGTESGILMMSLTPGPKAHGKDNSGSDFDFAKSISQNKKMALSLVISIIEQTQEIHAYRLTCEGKRNAIITLERTQNESGNRDQIRLFYGQQSSDADIRNLILSLMREI